MVLSHIAPHLCYHKPLIYLQRSTNAAISYNYYNCIICIVFFLVKYLSLLVLNFKSSQHSKIS